MQCQWGIHCLLDCLQMLSVTLLDTLRVMCGPVYHEHEWSILLRH